MNENEWKEFLGERTYNAVMLFSVLAYWAMWVAGGVLVGAILAGIF